ncbi:MAG: Gfo/Idh/MocA family oxidoreductase [Phycisphaerae bacterium]|nr:Gfo/Idh/MocA family oxidoreductase [Phycisphaerae bacterium]
MGVPVLAAGGVSAGLAPARAWSRTRSPIRVGLIGCGGRGTGAALQALRADSGAVLVAASDVFEDRLKSCLEGLRGELGDGAASRMDVPASRQFVGFDSYKGVIGADVDVVLLTSYPAFRPAHLKAAVDAGKHVFAEKPLAVDGPGLRSVYASADLAAARGQALLVGFCWRYNAGMRAVFEKITSGAIGKIQSVHTTYHTSTLSKRPRKEGWSDLEFQMRNWWHFTWVSGDHIVEQAIHSIDRLAWALGDRTPVRVNCLGGRAARSGPEHGNVYDHFAAIYEYADGTRAHHTCRQIDSCPNDNTDYVYGTLGSAVVNGWVPTYSIRGLAGQETWKHQGEIKDMYQVEHDELFASIRAGRPINDARRGANSTAMGIMARMAAYTGQTISWDQALSSKESLVPETLEFGPFPTPEVAVPGKTKFS